MISKAEAGQVVRLQKFRKGLTWAAIAAEIGKDPVWTVAALLGQHRDRVRPARCVGSTECGRVRDLGQRTLAR